MTQYPLNREYSATHQFSKDIGLSHLMSGQRYFCWALSLVVMVGCISNSKSSWRNPFGDTFVDYATFRVQFLEYETGEPIPDIEVSRRDAIPFRDSFWSWIWYGDDEVILSKLGVTDKQGIIHISNRDREATLECNFGMDTLTINCGDKYEVFYQRWDNGMPLEGSIQKSEDGVLQVTVPRVKK